MPMPRKWRVLVFPAGSEIAAEIVDALSWQKDIELVGAASVPDHSEMIFRELEAGLPFFNQPGFVDALNDAIVRHGIDFVYPARDDVQLYLMQHADELRARVVSSPLETVDVCRSKRATYALLGDEPFVPHTYEDPSEVPAFPVFAKPSVGEGSKGAQLVRSADQMQALTTSGVDYVFCEYLPGMPWTVDCFTDARGDLSVCLPRTRERVKAGIAVRSETVRDEALVTAIRDVAERINRRMAFVGAWFFQLKAREDGTPILMEVSPRVPGTMGLSRNLGINFPLLTIYQLLGYDITIPQPLACDALVDKAFISRYRLDLAYDVVYVDYDDTLTYGAEVNVQLVAFLYQCRNKGKRLVLLTRHDDEALGELRGDMARRGIAETLFDEIIHMDEGARKSDYVTDHKALFIDDSFRERIDVARRRGVPAFDVSNVEALLDWRR